MTLANIAAACGGTYHGNEEDQNKETEKASKEE